VFAAAYESSFPGVALEILYFRAPLAVGVLSLYCYAAITFIPHVICLLAMYGAVVLPLLWSLVEQNHLEHFVVSDRVSLSTSRVPRYLHRSALRRTYSSYTYFHICFLLLRAVGHFV